MTDATTLSLIMAFEGYQPTAAMDVNHVRLGYGSDTVTDADGTVREVMPGDATTPEAAQRDLERRIPETVQGIISVVGADAWGALDSNAQAAVTSLAYNYGGISGLPSLQRAIQSGDAAQISAAIQRRATDNGGINASRRTQEADLVLGRSIPALSGMMPPVPVGDVIARAAQQWSGKWADANAWFPTPAPLSPVPLSLESILMAEAPTPLPSTGIRSIEINPDGTAKRPADEIFNVAGSLHRPDNYDAPGAGPTSWFTNSPDFAPGGIGGQTVFRSGDVLGNNVAMAVASTIAAVRGDDVEVEGHGGNKARTTAEGLAVLPVTTVAIDPVTGNLVAPVARSDASLQTLPPPDLPLNPALPAGDGKYYGPESDRWGPFSTGAVPGMVAPGNIDLKNRPVFFGSDGTYGTERSFSIGTDKGEVLIPQIVGGKLVSQQEAIEHYKRTGENLGTFATSAAADAYATQLHQRDQGLGSMPVPMPGRPAALSAAPAAAQSAAAPTDPATGLPIIVRNGKQVLDTSGLSKEQIRQLLLRQQTDPKFTGKTVVGGIIGGIVADKVKEAAPAVKAAVGNTVEAAKTTAASLAGQAGSLIAGLPNALGNLFGGNKSSSTDKLEVIIGNGYVGRPLPMADWDHHIEFQPRPAIPTAAPAAPVIVRAPKISTPEASAKPTSSWLPPAMAEVFNKNFTVPVELSQSHIAAPSVDQTRAEQAAARKAAPVSTATVKPTPAPAAPAKGTVTAGGVAKAGQGVASGVTNFQKVKTSTAPALRLSTGTSLKEGHAGNAPVAKPKPVVAPNPLVVAPAKPAVVVRAPVVAKPRLAPPIAVSPTPRTTSAATAASTAASRTGQAAPTVTLKSGRTVPVGAIGTAQGGKYVYQVQADGSVKNLTTGRVTAGANQNSGDGGNGIGTVWDKSSGSWVGGGQ